MIQRLAVVTTENLPPLGQPCAGGGVRIWGLVDSLVKQNVNVTFFHPTSTERGHPFQPYSTLEHGHSCPHHFTIRSCKPELLQDELLSSDFDAVLVEQWQPMTLLRKPMEIPIIIDLPGPLILEYYWRDHTHFHQHIADKVECLSRADYFLCAHERQRGYYTSWLTWAGMAPDAERLQVVSFSLHEMPRSRQGFTEDEAQFFWGGMFWPWQDRLKAFETILQTLVHYRKGQLVIVGSSGGFAEGNTKSYEDFADHPHVSFLGTLPFNEYIIELKRATVAIDLSYPTEERRISSDLRTGTALWAGTPCIVAPESCWAKMILDHNAGWVLRYDSLDELKDLVREIALGRVDIVAKRRGAQEISFLLSQAENTSLMVRILDNPTKREQSKPFFESRFEEREQHLKDLQDELDQVRHEKSELLHDLNAIRSKALFRIYKWLTGWIGIKSS